MVDQSKYTVSPSGVTFITDWEGVFGHVPLQSGRKAVRCPFCSDERKAKNQKKKPCYVWAEEERFKCFNCDRYGYRTKVFTGVKYERPQPLPNDLPPEKMLSPVVVQYFAERGISQLTLQKMNVRTTEYCFPQDVTEDESGKPIFKPTLAIVYPYTYKGVLMFYKYRGMERQFAISKNPKLIFWNIDVLMRETPPTEVIITEGEPDALSWIECGEMNVLSVPNGASKRGNALEYLGRTIEFFEVVETIYLATDNDEAGLALREDLARRLGKHRIKLMKYPEGCKDSNDVLVKYGKDALLDVKKKAEPYPIEGVATLLDIEQQLDNLYQNGREPYHKAFLSNLDEYITWSHGNQLTGVSARPNSAKSDFLFNILLRLSIIYDMKWLIFSPETGDTTDIIELLMQIMTGRVFMYNGRDGANATLGAEEYAYCKSIIHKYFLFLDFDDIGVCTVETFLEKSEEAVKKYGVNGILADPYNHFSDGFSGDGEGGMALGLSGKLTMLKSFCRRFNTHMILVPHPAKLTGNEPMDNAYDIFGATMWSNKLDNLVFLNRLYETGMPEKGIGDDIDVRVRKIKKRHAGRRSEENAIKLTYEIATGRVGHTGQPFQTYHDWMNIRDSLNESDLPFESNMIIKQKPQSSGVVGGAGMLSSMLGDDLLPPQPLSDSDKDDEVPF